MKKKEVLKYLKNKSKEGYLTHSKILDIYEEDSNIPQQVVNLICYIPEPPKSIELIMGSKAWRNFENVFKEEFN